jgi:hypothetical protein
MRVPLATVAGGGVVVPLSLSLLSQAAVISMKDDDRGGRRMSSAMRLFGFARIE